MPITAPAPRFIGERRVEFVDREYADPGPGQLLLRVRANAVCGSERGQYFDGSACIPGHEAAGEVIAAGPGTTTPEGTHGVVFLMDFCGRCRSCLLGATNQCLGKRADMGFTHDGGYGPYELIHESVFFPVDEDIPFATATMLLDVMGTSGHALDRAGLVHPDIESVYIAGAGPVGLGLLAMAKIRLPDRVPVYVSDLSPWRRDLAAELGGIAVDPTDGNAMAAIPPPDAAFDSTGKQAARRAALDVLGKRGVLVCVGHGEGLVLDVSGDLITPEHAILGSEYFRYDDLAGNLRLLREHRDLVGKVVTHTFPVGDITRGFELFLSGETGKVVITQDGDA
ncbi:MAG TPA: alcohol dehydrogenase catalytic domain-containing protein [Mycobacteriales bacterium]|jgi:threonine dehydrogenase-like Zn-dependent dehydrogenase|nr:alcohol dehydrogenase catalytic domain-containing protein [Mycobacteriales bacterium]